MRGLQQRVAADPGKFAGLWTRDCGIEVPLDQATPLLLGIHVASAKPRFGAGSGSLLVVKRGRHPRLLMSNWNMPQVHCPPHFRADKFKLIYIEQLIIGVVLKRMLCFYWSNSIGWTEALCLALY